MGGLVLLAGLLLGYWYLRPNQAFIAPSLTVTSWDAVKDGTHNSNADMIYWRDAFSYSPGPTYWKAAAGCMTKAASGVCGSPISRQIWQSGLLANSAVRCA